MSAAGSRWADVKPHGTPAAYRRHYRHGEKPCQRCADAANRARRERYQPRAAPAIRPRGDAGRFTAWRAA